MGSDDKNNSTLSYPNRDNIKFDRHIKTRDCWVGGTENIVIINEKICVAVQDSVDINTYHRELDCTSGLVTKATVKLYNIKFTGNVEIFKDCTATKVK